MQAKTFGGEVFANNRHREIRSILPAAFFGQSKTIMTSLVGAATHLVEQLLPVAARQPPSLKIRPRPFAAMVKKSDIVVLLFQGPDFTFDEFIQFRKIGGYVRGDTEVQSITPW